MCSSDLKVEEMEEKVAFTVKLSVALSLRIPLLQQQETDSADLVRTSILHAAQNTVLRNCLQEVHHALL